MGNQVLLVTHQGVIDGHFKGIVRTHNKSQQMSLIKRDIIKAFFSRAKMRYSERYTNSRICRPFCL